MASNENILKTNCSCKGGNCQLSLEECIFPSQSLREGFMKLECKYEAKFKEVSLSKEDYAIYKLHQEAIQRGHFTYDDPLTGYKVFTRLRHFLRGSCCGNGCRHCIYDHQSVPIKLKGQKIFNGAFWLIKPEGVKENKHEPISIEKTQDDLAIESNDPLLFKH